MPYVLFPKNIGHANSAISTHGAIPSTQGTISSTVNTQTMNVSTSETSRISTGGIQSTITGLAIQPSRVEKYRNPLVG
jgi:hypothetical protein